MESKNWHRSSNGMVMGVCAGLAETFECPVGIMRLLWVLLGLCTAVLPMIIVYIILGIILKPASAVI
jgi:phage shock protein PspC (stress-responsive transcriptional regulator)